MILCDTAPLFSLVDKSQPHYQAVKLYIKNNPCSLITTWACFTEAMYLCLKRGGWFMQNQLGKLVLQKMLTLSPIEEDEHPRLLLLMNKYKDRPMDLADATLVITAERLNINKILTFDSDFFFYLINDVDTFDVINL